MSYYEFTIAQIDNGYQKIGEFDHDTLFINIYHFWCFANCLSMYHILRHTALDRLKNNIRKKWLKDFTNVNLFIELCERKTELISPFDFYFNSEDYFQKLIFLKSDLDKLIKEHHLTILPQKRRRRRRKLIRKCIR